MFKHFTPLRVLRTFSALVAVCLSVFVPQWAARADTLADVNSLLQSKQFVVALGVLEQHLVSQPRDPQMRFLLGVTQTQLGWTQEALVTYRLLTEDFPELPEPYNNMAVLYAEQNQLEQARVALEMAVRVNPAFAGAYENLGHVYLQLAKNAYQQALAADAARTYLSTQLTLIQQLGAPSSAQAGGISVGSP